MPSPTAQPIPDPASVFWQGGAQYYGSGSAEQDDDPPTGPTGPNSAPKPSPPKGARRASHDT